MTFQDAKFHTLQLLEIYKTHKPHTQLEFQQAILEHLKALSEIQLQDHPSTEHLGELHLYFTQTTFPYYPFEDTVHEVSVLEAIEKLLKSHASSNTLRNQFFDFLHKEMDSKKPLRNKLQNLHKTLVENL